MRINSLVIARQNVPITLADLKGGVREAHPPPPGHPNSFTFMQFLEEFGKITSPRRFHALTWGKSWIRIHSH